MSDKPQTPVPQGRYHPAVRHNELVYTSGMTPREGGVLKHQGAIRANDPLEKHQDAVQIATDNALAAAESCLEAGEVLARVLQLNVFLNAEPAFAAHANLADSASNTIAQHLGNDALGSRAAIGVASLPSSAPVEISMVCLVQPA